MKKPPDPAPFLSLYLCSVSNPRFAHPWASIPRHSGFCLSYMPLGACRFTARLSLCRLVPVQALLKIGTKLKGGVRSRESTGRIQPCKLMVDFFVADWVRIAPHRRYFGPQIRLIDLLVILRSASLERDVVLQVVFCLCPASRLMRILITAHVLDCEVINLISASFSFWGFTASFSNHGFVAESLLHGLLMARRHKVYPLRPKAISMKAPYGSLQPRSAFCQPTSLWDQSYYDHPTLMSFVITNFWLFDLTIVGYRDLETTVVIIWFSSVCIQISGTPLSLSCIGNVADGLMTKLRTRPGQPVRDGLVIVMILHSSLPMYGCIADWHPVRSSMSVVSLLFTLVWVSWNNLFAWHALVRGIKLFSFFPRPHFRTI